MSNGANKDVEYHVDKPNGETAVFSTAAEAAGLAVSLALSGKSAVIDVVIWSEAGALAYGGDDAVERYREDPNASVFERLEISVNVVGRVP